MKYDLQAPTSSWILMIYAVVIHLAPQTMYINESTLTYEGYKLQPIYIRNVFLDRNFLFQTPNLVSTAPFIVILAIQNSLIL